MNRERDNEDCGCDCVDDGDVMTEDMKEVARDLADILEQFMDDLSNGSMIFPGHGVCRQAWEEAESLLRKHAGTIKAPHTPSCECKPDKPDKEIRI